MDALPRMPLACLSIAPRLPLGCRYNPQGSISVDVEALRMIVSMRDAAEAEAAAEAAEQRRLGLEANERLQSTTRWQQSRPSKQSATARPRSGNDRALGRS